jgi:hypothetical protein
VTTDAFWCGWGEAVLANSSRSSSQRHALRATGRTTGRTRPSSPYEPGGRRLKTLSSGLTGSQKTCPGPAGGDREKPAKYKLSPAVRMAGPPQRFRPDMRPVVRPQEREGVLVGSGDGTVHGPEIPGTIRWSNFETEGISVVRNGLQVVVRHETDGGLP